jgi:hypothetical protein
MTNAGVSYQINWPASQGGAATFLKNDGSGNLTWETSGSTLPVVDTTSIVKGSADATKLLRFEIDGFTTGTTRVLTPPNADITIVGRENAETITGQKTFDVAILANDGIDARNNSAANVATLVNDLKFTQGNGAMQFLIHINQANALDIRDSASNLISRIDDLSNIWSTSYTFYPGIAGVDLGLSSSRFNKLWSIDIDTSGTILTGGGVTIGSGGSQGVNCGSFAIAGVTIIDGSANISTLGNINTGGEYRVDGTRIATNRGAAVTKPTGGSTVDDEARTAIDAIIDRLRVTGGHGLISD